VIRSPVPGVHRATRVESRNRKLTCVAAGSRNGPLLTGRSMNPITGERNTMSDLTRRAFVKSSAGAAAGMTAVGAIVAAQAEADEHAVGSEPVVAYVKDPRKGEISVMSGDREVSVHDRTLAARIARAAR
jgi:hypothetical protein